MVFAGVNASIYNQRLYYSKYITSGYRGTGLRKVIFWPVLSVYVFVVSLLLLLYALALFMEA